MYNHVQSTFHFFRYLRGIHAMWWSYHSFPIFSRFHLISHPSSWFAALFSSQVRHPCIGETVGHLKTRLRRQIPAGRMMQCLSSNPKCPNCLGWLKVHESFSKTCAAKCSVDWILVPLLHSLKLFYKINIQSKNVAFERWCSFSKRLDFQFPCQFSGEAKIIFVKFPSRNFSWIPVIPREPQATPAMIVRHRTQRAESIPPAEALCVFFVCFNATPLGESENVRELIFLEFRQILRVLKKMWLVTRNALGSEWKFIEHPGCKWQTPTIVTYISLIAKLKRASQNSWSKT